MQDGVVLQELPFDVELRKFIVEYYETGMPKLFASEIVIHDHETGAATPTTVKVNEPAFHRGVAIYQSSFDDGGSTVKLRAFPLLKDGKSFDVEGTIGASTTLSNGDAQHDARVHRAARDQRRESLGAAGRVPALTCARSTSSPVCGINSARVRNRIASASCATSGRPSATSCATRRDKRANTTTTCCRSNSTANGCTSSEPATTRTTACAICAFRPTIPTASRAGCGCAGRCLDPSLREQAAARYVALATPTDKPEMAPQLQTTALRVLALFAGADSSAPASKAAACWPISDFMESSVPEADRPRISEVLAAHPQRQPLRTAEPVAAAPREWPRWCRTKRPRPS